MTAAATDERTAQPQLIGGDPPALRRDPVATTWVTVATLSWFGDAVLTVALAWTAVHLLSPALAGLVVGVDTLPQALLMLLGGVIADRFDTRVVMLAGEIARTVVLLAATAAWSLDQHRAVILFAVAVAFGTAAGLSNPARATLARQLVRTEDLTSLSGAIQVASRLARLAGAPAGAILVAAGGLGPAMLVDAATFAAVAAALLLVIRPRYALPRASAGPWLGSVADGLRYLRANPAARWLTLGISSLNVFVTPVLGLGVALRVSEASWGASWVGVAQGAFAASAILGSLAAIRWQRGNPAPRAFWLLVMQAAALAAVGVPSKLSLVGALVVVGLTAGAASVWLSGVFQQTIAASHLGRVSAVSNMGDLALTPAMLVVFGLAVSHSNLVVCCLGCGAAMAALCAFFAARTTQTR